MPSQFDEHLADDWERAFDEFKVTVIRRIRGDAARTESVEDAIPEFDDESGGWADDADGQRVQIDGKLEISADQETTAEDAWVVEGVLYHQIGEPTGFDGGSKTILLRKIKGKRGRRPRVSQR